MSAIPNGFIWGEWLHNERAQDKRLYTVCVDGLWFSAFRYNGGKRTHLGTFLTDDTARTRCRQDAGGVPV